jgi:dTDP-4-dehydrorhamnose 3,5-epimerase
MQVTETELPGVLVITPRVFSDTRGFFLESYNERQYGEWGMPTRFVQDNHSRSTRGTLRGLHFQVGQPQAKLCRVLQGEVFDVAVDIRRGSPTFGRWVGVVLSGENHRQLFVPAGFAHGFLVLSETADFLYKCDDFYHPAGDRGIAWDDPLIKIEWPLEGPPLLSAKDAALPRLHEAPELPHLSPGRIAPLMSAAEVPVHA